MTSLELVELSDQVRQALRELPTDQARLDFVNDMTDEICTECGSVTKGYVCHCARDE